MENTKSEQIKELLERGVDAVYPNIDKFEARLSDGKPMKVYFGIDPTSPQLHIGHAIGLRKMRQFQDLGHEVIILLGSFTAMIGDPTGKSSTRNQLTQKEVLENAAGYKKVASKILSFTGNNPAKIVFNHKWLSKMSFQDVVELSSHFTVQQMMERDMFEKRLKDGRPVYLHEFLYPLMQGYDSVAMEVDAEVGGSDQMFNMLAGRTLERAMIDKEKFVLTTKLLTNADGEKMSKTAGGFIALSDSPEDMYGKIMAMDDSVILTYFELATDVPMEEIEGMGVQMKNGMNPRDIKAKLAEEIVRMYHGADGAQKAVEHFSRVFQDGLAPEEMKTYSLQQPMNIIDVLLEVELVSSKSEARRMIEQGAIKIDGEPVEGIEVNIEKVGIVLQRGKRHFVKII
ncbi:tyrosine--tRNA ligase [Patescibacteria group bacterium]|nr:tyrosine--tRNA ligase [Patescibacteria group bacterium]